MTTEHNYAHIGDETARNPDVVYVHPSQEAQVAKRCGIREIDCYFPQYRVEYCASALDPLHAIQQSVDPTGIPALNPKDSVDRFNQCSDSRLPGTQGVDLDPVLISRHV
jgi:hypothetical protein